MCARHQKDQLLGGRKKEPGMTNWQSERGCFREKGIFHKMESLSQEEREVHEVWQGRYKLDIK